MINYNNFNYLYNQNGKTVAVNKKSDEAKIHMGSDAATVSGASSSTGSDFDKMQWIILDDVQLNDCVTVDKLSVEQVVSLFCNGNLTVNEFEKWFDSKGISDYTINTQSNMYNIKFNYQNKNYDLKCSIENAEFQTDTMQTGEINVKPESTVTVDSVSKPEDVTQILQTLKEEAVTAFKDFFSTETEYTTLLFKDNLTKNEIARMFELQALRNELCNKLNDIEEQIDNIS